MGCSTNYWIEFNMNNILAIDSSSEYLCLGISINLKHYQQQLKIGNRHSEVILPEIDNLLKIAGISLKEINLIAYNYGPGAFTGLRIGLSCALGLAYTHKIPLAAIPAFMLYSNDKTISSQYLGVCLDARLNQVYFAIIDQSSYNFIVEPCLLEPENVHEIILGCELIKPDSFQITGNGISVYKDKINDSIFTNYKHYQQEYPKIERMLKLAENTHYQSYNYTNADLMYIRNKVALNLEEQKRNKQLS